MPLVKLTIRAEPQEVSDDELAALQGQNLVESVLPAPGDPAGGADDAVVPGGSSPDDNDPSAQAGGGKEKR